MAEVEIATTDTQSWDAKCRMEQEALAYIHFHSPNNQDAEIELPVRPHFSASSR